MKEMTVEAEESDPIRCTAEIRKHPLISGTLPVKQNWNIIDYVPLFLVLTAYSSCCGMCLTILSWLLILVTFFVCLSSCKSTVELQIVDKNDRNGWL